MGSKHNTPAGNSLQHERPNSEATTEPTGLFSGSNLVQINNSQLNDFSHVHYHDDRRKKSNLEHLQQYISEGALHDSIARFPPPMCHPQTREKVLKIITDWVNDPHTQQPIIWLTGPAGAGKSAIAQTVAGHCSDNQLAASFFFLRNSSDRGTVTRLFTTLAWQLAKNIPELLSYVGSAVEKEPLFPTRSLDIQIDRLIVQPLQELLRDKPDFCPQKFLIVIDGVDECAPDRDQMLFLRLIGNALSRIHIPLRFLICSRREPHIREAFESEVMTRITYEVSLHNQFDPDNDIRRFLKDEFSRIRAEHKHFKLPPEWPPDWAIDQLVSKSSGQFIYASTVVKFVDVTYDDPRERLDVLLNTRPVNSASPFAELDQLYIQILSQQPNVRLLRDLFTLIIASRKPEIKFVCRRLRIREEQLQCKLLRLRSLVHISDRDITTYHLSLHDFFLDKKRAGKYFIHPIRVTFLRLPNIMGSARRPMITLFLMLLITPQLVVFRVLAALVYGIPSKRAYIPTTPGILLFFFTQSAMMNDFTSVNGLHAYLIMTSFLTFLSFCVGSTHRSFNLWGDGLSSGLLRTIILPFWHVAALRLYMSPAKASLPYFHFFYFSFFNLLCFVRDLPATFRDPWPQF